MNAISPCPKCGCKAVKIDYLRNAVTLVCLRWDCQHEMSEETIDEAITAWNHRNEPVGISQ